MPPAFYVKNIYFVVMENNNLIGDGPKRSRRKGSVTLMFVIFVLGVIVGVIGLCVALKFIFYIGLAVIIVVAMLLVWFLLKVRSDERNRGNDNVERLNLKKRGGALREHER